jgi:phage gp36-like protein
MAQSQYGQPSDLTSLAITAAAGQRFGNTAMNAALQAASSIIDTYLPSQFTLPLQVSPQGWDMGLTMHACWIAAYLLYNNFGYAPMAPGDEMVAKRYESSLEWLAQIRDKKIFPQYIDSAGAPTAEEQGPFVVSDSPVGFTGRGLNNDDPTEYINPPGGYGGNGGWTWWE